MNLQAGIRYQRIDSDTESFKPTVVAIQGDLLGQPVASVAAGSVDHDKTLFNLGAVYKFNDQQQVFANFSQGFSLPDIQRVLRDVSASYVVRSGNVIQLP